MRLPVFLAVDTFFLAVLFWIGIYGILITIAIGVWANFVRMRKMIKALERRR